MLPVKLVLTVLVTALVLDPLAALAVNRSDRPNVLLVVADDLGYTDLGSFGGEIATPNLDALAASGLRLTNFYTAPTCSPTRSMLLTGADSHLVGLGSMAEALTPDQRGKPGYEGYLNDRAVTLPEVFSSAGYRTLMSGKWHLGLEQEHSPAARGFQQSFALLEGGAGHLDDLGIESPRATFRENGELAEIPEHFYSSRFYTDKLIGYLEAGRESGRPFFAYLAYTAPHWPLQAPQESIAEYSGRYAMGYDALHQQRVAAAIKAGVSPANSVIQPRKQGQPAWDQLSDEQRRVEQRKMEIYAAMIDDLDDQFGRLMDYLASTGQLDNTIIFFMSDNGAEGGDFDSHPPVFREHAKNCCDNSYENMGRANSYLFAGPNWARASVGPYRDYKAHTTEGGIRAPAIVRYPGLDDPNGRLATFATVKDVMPTLLRLAGLPLPQAEDRLPVTGRSILDPGDEAAPVTGWELFGNRALREGDWKIVHLQPRFGGSGWQLFNLAEDPGEQHDLATKQPEKMKQLLRLWEQYEQQNQLVYPTAAGAH